MIAWPANCPANVYCSMDFPAWQWMCKSMWEGALIAGFTVAFISMPLDGLMHMNGKAYPGLKASSTSPPNLAFHSHWQFYEQLERRISLYWLFTGRHVRGYQFADDSVFFLAVSIFHSDHDYFCIVFLASPRAWFPWEPGGSENVMNKNRQWTFLSSFTAARRWTTRYLHAACIRCISRRYADLTKDALSCSKQIVEFRGDK